MEYKEIQPLGLDEKYERFQDILSDEELKALFDKHGIRDERERKLPVYYFFWLMVLSAVEPKSRGCILSLIGFFLGAISLLFSVKKITKLSKTAVSKRLCNIRWYLFRGVYNHLLGKYQDILGSGQLKFLKQFKEVFLIDGSTISICKKLEPVFKSIHKGKSALKLNVKYSLKIETLTKLQVTNGKRHDSLFQSVTKEPGILYLFDLGYWSFKLLQKIINAGSCFVFRLKSSCDPLIVQVSQQEFGLLIGKRLSEIGDFLKKHTELDVTVQLSKAKKPEFTENIRLIGLLYEGEWRFYITNIFDITFIPQFIYELYALCWQVEIFFNLIKNVLKLQNIMARTKNGIMIEICSALIFYLLTRIIIALAAQKTGKNIHEFSFERSFKIVRGFFLADISLFFQKSSSALDYIFRTLIKAVAAMGVRPKKPRTVRLNQALNP